MIDNRNQTPPTGNSAQEHNGNSAAQATPPAPAQHSFPALTEADIADIPANEREDYLRVRQQIIEAIQNGQPN